jgi:hypothetical protein
VARPGAIFFRHKITKTRKGTKEILTQRKESIDKKHLVLFSDFVLSWQEKKPSCI